MLYVKEEVKTVVKQMGMWKISDFFFLVWIWSQRNLLRNKTQTKWTIWPFEEQEIQTQSKGKHCTVAQREIILMALIGGNFF